MAATLGTPELLLPALCSGAPAAHQPVISLGSSSPQGKEHLSTR